jgi:hypothetical protein
MKKSIIALSACLLVISIFVGYGHSRSSRNSSNNRDEREPSASIVVNPRDGSTSTYVRDGSGTGGGTLIDHRTGHTSTVVPGGTVIPSRGGPPGNLTPGGTVEWPDH